MLDEKPVKAITPYLTTPGRVVGEPFRLAANGGICFQGAVVLGMGFVVSPDQARELIAGNPRNRDVLFPYLNGEDLNSRPDQSPSRWVINFYDWPLNRSATGSWFAADDDQRDGWIREGIVPSDYPGSVASDYSDCLDLVELKVKPERDRVKRKVYREKWWRFAERQYTLYQAVGDISKCICIAATSRTIAFAWVNTGIVFAHALYVFASDKDNLFGVLMSEIGRAWALHQCSSMKQDFRYTNSDGFETLPLPQPSLELQSIAREYSSCRKSIMLQRNVGLTRTYDLVNDSDENTEDIEGLRRLHVEMDRAVARAYGWDDLDLGHGFHETRHGERFSISEAARQEVLDRLLTLNHERYAEEVRQGLHEKGAKKKARRQPKVEPAPAGHRAAQPEFGFDFQLTPPRAARR